MIRQQSLGGVLAIALAAGACAQAAEFAPDPSRSTVEVGVRATVDSFTAKLDEYRTSIQVDASGRPTAGTFTWDFKDLNTTSPRRDKEMLHWLDHEHTPAAVFTFERLVSTNTPCVLAGTLKMHGVTNQLSVPISIAKEGTNLTWEGTLELDHRPYALPRIVKLGLLRVNPVLTVHFKLAGTVKE